ncbi:MAG: helicase HerA domain-containing protein, partial [Thermoplasmata archaeon]
MEPLRPLGRWTFQPGLALEPRGDDRAAFRDRLLTGLRAGHGVGARFRLRWTSGPAATLSLIVDSPSAMRWAVRALLPAYDRHPWQWRPMAASEAPLVEVWDGRRTRAWPDPLRVGVDGASVLDSVGLALASIPGGVACDWSFSPVPLGHASWWDLSAPIPAPPGPARSFPRPSVTSAYAPEASPSRPAFWRARVRVECRSTVREPELGALAARAIESATRGAQGNGIRLRRGRSSDREREGGFPMSESEVVLTLPGPDAFGVRPSVGAYPGRFPLLPLGRTTAGFVVGPPIEPAQGRHLAVLGETGMGKSSLLVSLSRKIAADAGLILFDPLGETARAVGEEIPREAKRRVTWVEPSGTATLNALEGIRPGTERGEGFRERQLNDLVQSLRRVRSGRYADSGFWGPRLEEMLTRALSAAAAFPQGTIADAHTLLASGGRGFRVIPTEATEVVRDLADRMRSRPEDADGARRLLFEVTRSPILARMLCAQAPTVRAADLVAPGRISLIVGDAAVVGESTARYLLSVYLALLWSELLARPDLAK